MNAVVAFRRAALALVLLSLAAYAASERNVWVLVLGGLAAVASAAITEGPRGRALSPWIVRVGVIIAMAWGTFDFASRPTLNPADAPRVVGAVVLAVLLLKMFERKGPVDWRQILALSVVLVVAAALSSSDFVVGVLVIAYGGTAVAAVMLYQLYAGAERALADRRAAAVDARTLPPVEAPGGLAPGRHFRRVVVVSLVLGISMSATVFVLFPRESIFSSAGQGNRQSGFNPKLWLWGGERISLSSRVAMTVQLLDPRGVPGELATPLRLRGAVLDRYNASDALWVATRDRASEDRVFETSPHGDFQWFAPEARQERSNVWTEVIEMRSLASEHVFSAWLPLAIDCSEQRSFLFNGATGVMRERTGGIAGRPQRYQVRMQAFPIPRLVQSVTPLGEAEVGVTFPLPEMREEAQRILTSAQLEGIPTEADIAVDPVLRWERNRRLARLFEGYLSGEGFRYTTDMSGFRRVRGADPIYLFLTRYKAGHCEYFASGLAALCQSMGVEARVVTGFMATEYDTVTARYMVRESSAHAWVEVRTGDWQWSTFDPSPISELLAIQQANRTWLDRFRWLLDPVEFAWNSRVASFDSGAQADLAERFGGGARGAADSFRDWGKGLVQRVNDWFLLGPAGTLWLGLVGAVAVIAVVAAVTVARRIARVRRELGAVHDGAVARALLGRDAAFYLEALDVLARAGLAKPRSCTPRLHAAAISSRSPAASQAFAEVVDRFYEVRYAGRRLTRAERAAADLLVARLREALARGYTRPSAA